ncbi:MAG: cytochrome c [Raineya sp.]|nr:cytochrome c [Raineya sp.]MDW8295298.1 cytochrome c [Raineya sp.]
MRLPKSVLAVFPVLFFIGLLLGNLFFFKTQEQGQKLYAQHCASCHMEKGEGLANLIPPLAEADWLAQNPEKVACIIRYGQTGEVRVNGKTYNHPMPANLQLSDTEIHNITNFILSNFGNKVSKRTFEQITKDLRTCH